MPTIIWKSRSRYLLQKFRRSWRFVCSELCSIYICDLWLMLNCTFLISLTYLLICHVVVVMLSVFAIQHWVSTFLGASWRHFFVKYWRDVLSTLEIFWECAIQCAAIKQTPVNKYHYFQYSSMFFYKIFRDYSPHNLPLLLQILSSYLSLFRSSTVLNIKDDFFNCADK